MHKYLLLFLVASTISTTSLQASARMREDEGEKTTLHSVRSSGTEKQEKRDYHALLGEPGEDQADTHCNHGIAVYLLLRSQNIVDQAMNAMYERRISEFEEEERWKAVNKSWRFRNEEGHAFVRPIYITVAQDKNHPKRWDAISILWHSSNEEDQAVARHSLREIAQDDTNLYQWDAVDRLRNSTNQEDHTFAGAIYSTRMDPD